MSDKKVVEFSKGEADLNIDFKDGKLRVSASYDGKGADVGVYVDIEPDYFLDKLAAAIPGEIDDKVIALLKAAF